MMDPKTAIWLSGRIDPSRDRAAMRLAALRDADASAPTDTRSTFERVQAFFGRAGSPARACCACCDA
jgi:hypothetical protein